MKILSARQSRQADKYTIENEPVSSVELMERAAVGLNDYLLKTFTPKPEFYIFCGKGNNGGDGLALARLLSGNKRNTKVFIVEETGHGSEDFKINLQKLQTGNINFKNITEVNDLPEIPENAIIIDAIFGSGLNRPLEGLAAKVIKLLNQNKAFKIAIDIPSGLFVDDNNANNLENIFRTDLTLTIQQPKLSFFHRQTAPLVGKFKIININLHPEFLEDALTVYHYIDFQEAREIYKPRDFFTYKNKYGHALIIAGAEGKIGAAVLSAKGALHAGAGLVSIYTARAGLNPLQTTLPEAMVMVDENQKYISTTPQLSGFTSVVMGPGIGTNKITAPVLKEVITNCKVPLILDADALNILSHNRDWYKLLPPETILTPHIGEYKRLMGVEELNENYLDELRDFCRENKIHILLKDAISTICTPNGELYFVKSGSPALATAGSGDTLCGILAALAGCGYPLLEALILGVWMHGRAGKLAGMELSEEATLAGDISMYLGKVFKELKGNLKN